MSISPPTDLIVDVMRQADPGKVREASERLAAIGRSAPPAAAGDDFRAHVKKAILEATGEQGRAGQQGPVQAPLSMAQDGHARVHMREKMSPGEQLEAFVLTGLIESMMPKDAESVFGSGTAGSYWRSVLAQKLAAELTMAGGVGLRDQLRLREVDKPEAAEMLRAVLDAGKTPAEVASETTDVLGLGAFGGRAASEMMPARLDETNITQPESNGA